MCGLAPLRFLYTFVFHRVVSFLVVSVRFVGRVVAKFKGISMYCHSVSEEVEEPSGSSLWC